MILADMTIKGIYNTGTHTPLASPDTESVAVPQYAREYVFSFLLGAPLSPPNTAQGGMEWLRKQPRTVDLKIADGCVRGSLVRDREYQEVVAIFK